MFPLRDDNPTTRMPILTIGLILANVAAFGYQHMQGPQFEQLIMQYGFIPYELTHGAELTPQTPFPSIGTIFTSMFMHGSLMHLIGNMLYLWIFGNNIEDKLGHGHYLPFYLLSGVGAVLLFVVFGPNGKIPLIGASGAVSGVLGMYAVRFPKARVYTMLPGRVGGTWMPAMAVLGIWFVMQLIFAFMASGAEAGGGVAYMAHVGGFLVGVLGAMVYGGRFRTSPA